MMPNTIVSFVILLVARTARIACTCADRQTHTQDNYTVTLSAHARRGLIIGASLSEPHIYRTVVQNVYVPSVRLASNLAPRTIIIFGRIITKQLYHFKL